MGSRPQSARASSPSPQKGYENYDLDEENSSNNAKAITTLAPPPASRGGDGGASTIGIYVRVKPQPKPSPRLAVDLGENRLEFNLPREAAAGYVNNQRENYDFRFNGIIGPQAKQDEVFERVARGVVMGTMEGYNGTIFAYGQTGSGKTFTITGGPSAYADRGIIPRTISTIFSEITKRSDHSYTVHVSYLEIYNETGYDLLDPNREIKAMEDLPTVHVMEDEENRTSFRNLNIHRANNEEEALNLLFLGDTNRTISETPMNMASSRSHCIFTIYLEARKHGEDVVRRSKLNLVDLAGSERASKTGIDGTTLREAKYINLSLHYLEQVIIALQERSMGLNRPHIPYRNSKMTQVLRDSLGGNCRTIMIATISADQGQLDESISTCRFAMRVALVRNVVALNEEMDPSLVIRRLKQEIRDLKEELRLMRGAGEDRGPLTPDEIKRLQEQIEAYCADQSPEASLNLGGSMLFIRAAFDVFKQMAGSGGFKPGGAAAGGKGGEDAGQDTAEQIRKLKLQVTQRDNEINILVGMIKRRDGAAGAAAAWPPNQAAATNSPSTASAVSGSYDSYSSPGGGGGGSLMAAAAAPRMAWGADGSGMGGAVAGLGPGSTALAAGRGSGAGGGAGKGGVAGGTPDPTEQLMNASLLADRNQAFELFRKSYRQNEVIEENKAALKSKYESAKTAGAVVNDSKARINDLKALIEQRRIQRSVARVAQGAEGEEEGPDAEEERCKTMIEKEKSRYKDAFEDLRGLKKEIEHLHMLLEQSRTRLQRDFEQWMTLMARQAAAGELPSGGTGGGIMGAVGGRPPISSTGPSSVTSSMDLGQSLGQQRGGGGGGKGVVGGGGGGAAGGGSFVLRSSSSGFRDSGAEGGTGGRPTSGRPTLPGSLSAPAPVPTGPRQAWGEAAAGGGGVPAAASSYGSASGSGSWTSGGGGAGAAGALGKAAGAAGPLDLKSVDPQVLADARPYLTGNPEADQDILRFYIAKQQLLLKLQGGGA